MIIDPTNNRALIGFTTHASSLKRLALELELELELGLMQSQMAQKPVLRGEVGARALRVRSVPREEVWASAGMQGAWVSWCGCFAHKASGTAVTGRSTWL